MKKIRISESQLYALASLLEQVSAQRNAISNSSGSQVNKNSVTNQDGVKQTMSDDNGNVVTKKEDGTATITVNKDKTNDVTAIKSLAMKAGVDQNKTNVVRGVDNNNDNTFDNSIPLSVGGNEFKNMASTKDIIANYKKMFSKDPNTLTTSTTLRQLNENSLTLSKRDIVEQRRKYLLENSYGITKRNLSAIIKNK